MNLLLVDRREISANGTVRLEGRRAEHLRNVLRVTIGDTCRAGIVGGELGTARVMAIDPEAITMHLESEGPPRPPLPIEIVLAIPRPKVLSRTLEHLAAFGVSRIDLTNAWRVDKSYLGSPRLQPDHVDAALRLGAEQGATTHLPDVHVHRRLMTLLDARWPAEQPPMASRLIAHPGSPPVETVRLVWPAVIAIGPEGGWIPRELETFVSRGFTPVSIGEPILRVEAAISAVVGQLILLRRMQGI